MRCKTQNRILPRDHQPKNISILDISLFSYNTASSQCNTSHHNNSSYLISIYSNMFNGCLYDNQVDRKVQANTTSDHLILCAPISDRNGGSVHGAHMEKNKSSGEITRSLLSLAGYIFIIFIHAVHYREELLLVAVAGKLVYIRKKRRRNSICTAPAAGSAVVAHTQTHTERPQLRCYPKWIDR